MMNSNIDSLTLSTIDGLVLTADLSSGELLIAQSGSVELPRLECWTTRDALVSRMSGLLDRGLRIGVAAAVLVSTMCLSGFSMATSISESVVEAHVADGETDTAYHVDCAELALAIVELSGLIDLDDDQAAEVWDATYAGCIETLAN